MVKDNKMCDMKIVSKHQTISNRSLPEEKMVDQSGSTLVTDQWRHKLKSKDGDANGDGQSEWKSHFVMAS